MVEDRQAGGGWSPGGPSLYSARMAQALGARVRIVTGVHPRYDRSAFTGLELIEAPADSNPRFENTYDESGDRTQLLLHPGSALDGIDWEAIPPADVLIVAPAFHEFACMPAVEAHVVAVSLQGALRALADGDRVVPAGDALAAALPFAPPNAHVFFSEEDTHRPEALATELARHGVTVLVTHGYRGATLYRDGAVEDYAAIPTVRTVDPTGAGDCFSTTFIVRFAETGDTGESMRYALAAGALAVEGAGLAGIPTRSAIEARLREVAA